MYSSIYYALVLATLALATGPVAAQYAPWCSRGAESCTFYSFEQCMETVRGSSTGMCTPNPNTRSSASPTAAGRRRPR